MNDSLINLFVIPTLEAIRGDINNMKAATFYDPDDDLDDMSYRGGSHNRTYAAIVGGGSKARNLISLLIQEFRNPTSLNILKVKKVGENTYYMLEDGSIAKDRPGNIIIPTSDSEKNISFITIKPKKDIDFSDTIHFIKVGNTLYLLDPLHKLLTDVGDEVKLTLDGDKPDYYFRFRDKSRTFLFYKTGNEQGVFSLDKNYFTKILSFPSADGVKGINYREGYLEVVYHEKDEKGYYLINGTFLTLSTGIPQHPTRWVYDRDCGRGYTTKLEEWYFIENVIFSRGGQIICKDKKIKKISYEYKENHEKSFTIAYTDDDTWDTIVVSN